MYAVYAWNLFVWRVERIAVLLYVKNVGALATQKGSNTDSRRLLLFVAVSTPFYSSPLKCIDSSIIVGKDGKDRKVLKSKVPGYLVITANTKDKILTTSDLYKRR